MRPWGRLSAGPNGRFVLPIEITASPLEILQILSVTIFEKTPILEGFSNFTDESEDPNLAKQLKLFEF
jgi:hypothetical protein